MSKSFSRSFWIADIGPAGEMEITALDDITFALENWPDERTPLYDEAARTLLAALQGRTTATPARKAFRTLVKVSGRLMPR